MDLFDLNIDKKHLIYAGIGAVALLVLYYSTRKEVLVEVSPPPTGAIANFDHSSLPDKLQPPERLADDAVPPTPVKRAVTLNAIGAKPRFDTNNNNIFF